MYLTSISFQNVTSAFNESRLFMSQWNVFHEESFMLKRFYPLPTLCVNCPYSELFWSAFSRIRTECGEIRSNADKNNFEYGHFWRSAIFVKMLHHRCLTGFWIRFWCIYHQQYITEFIRVNPGQTWSFTKKAETTCFKINPGIKTTNNHKAVPSLKNCICNWILFWLRFNYAYPISTADQSYWANSFHFRSSHLEVFQRKSVLKICSKFTGKHPCRSAISIKLQSNFIEIALRHGCSPVNLLYIFRTPFLWTAAFE